MFVSLKKTLTRQTNAEIVVKKNIHFKENIRTRDSVKIDGGVAGNVVTSADLKIGKSGSINGSVKAQNAAILGTVYGNVNISGKLELFPSAKIYGDIRTNKLIVNHGAILNGACHVRKKKTVAVDM